MPIFNKPHKYLFLGFYYSIFYFICKKCKINSKEFHLTMVQLYPNKLVKDQIKNRLKDIETNIKDIVEETEKKESKVVNQSSYVNLFKFRFF